MSARHRVGVVGSGFGGLVHVPAFQAQGGFEVVALASPRRAADVARERGVPHAFDSVEAMLDGVELDVVSVASPPYDHHRSVLAALRRGKHVLCEKPFGLNVAECEELVAAAASAGTVCAIAHEFRYTPARFAASELIANGHLGAVREIEFAVSGTWLRAGAAVRGAGWWFEHRLGGGIAGAYLSHFIDYATTLAGRHPVRSCGFTRTANPTRRFGEETFTSDVADGAFALVDYGGGLIGRIEADMTHAKDSLLIAVHGEERTVVTSGSSFADPRTFAVDAEQTDELELAPQQHANLAAAHQNLPAFVTLLDAFASALGGGPAELPTFADGLATQRVLATIGFDAPSVT